MQWTQLQKIGFRFLSIYLFLFTMSNQFFPSFAFDALWQKVVPWFAETFLSLDIQTFTNGSGDTTYNYLSLLVYLIIAVIGCIIWSVLDRERPNYKKLFQWFVMLIRYYVIFQMILYGMAKLFYMQFQPPRFSQLIQPYGESSPMRILWTFMGQSKGYTIFAGFGELVGGLLLLSRRTTTLGALVVFGVMANVMAMNFFYDVPVKILSSHLVLMSLFLIALDYKRLANLFMLNRPTEIASYPPYFSNPKFEKAKNIIKWLLIGVGLILSVIQMINLTNQYGFNAPKPKLYGLYEVEEFTRNQDTIPPLLTDQTRWRRMIVQNKDRATIYDMTNNQSYYDFIPDSTANFILMKPRGDSLASDTLYFSEPDSTHFRLEGVFKNDTINILMRRKLEEDFLLRNRGFRWINESPFNR